MASGLKSINLSAFWAQGKQTFRQLKGRHYVSGLLVFGLLFSLYANSLFAVFDFGRESSQGHVWQQLWQAVTEGRYVRQVLFFSFWQAGLSALLSVFLGAWFARAFFYQPFWGKKALLRLFSLTFVLPSLVAVFGILGVYGASGWLAQFCAWLGVTWRPDIYGLSGILIAHLFFNIPLAMRLFLQAYQGIPIQQHQLAAQLGIRRWTFIRWVEWPYLRQSILPTVVLIFMLCFTSFAIVLVLGGGPKFTTLEVAIYQAIIFDFDLAKATQFALLQGICFFVLFALSTLLGRNTETQLDQSQYWVAKQSSAVKFGHVFLLLLFSAFLLLPLLNTLCRAVFSPAMLSVWQQSALWRAMGYSFTLAPLSALLALLLAVGLLLSSRRLQWIGLSRFSNGVINITLVMLAVPMLMLATGLFLWLKEWQFSTAQLFGLIILCNAVLALPFVMRILAVPMTHNLIYYERLCQSLGVTGWQRFKWIEWQALRQPVKYAFALASCLSLGDFTAIALFGNQDFSSLPYLLYQQLGSYRGEEGAVTALVLLVSCFVVFSWVESEKSV
ncbi:thiamine/thiamine pyrophosphate ABC transporter permease ThiP [Lonepinella sp. BR2271]|uniref:thiamine/thiamine pyrophosphate ABC transporter permease ThiP n=1 Tax=Lonepinella sp. BR2271 TaxID=3434550 RepID=UPI003F6DFD55